MFKFNLQHFAGTDLTPAGGDEEQTTSMTSTGDDTEEEESGAEGETQPETEVEEEAKPEKAETHEPDDTTPWVKKRLARAEKAFERRFLEEVNADSAGHELSRQDLPRAGKLWNLLKVNPELSKKINELISEEVGAGKAKALEAVQSTSGYDAREQRLILREAKLELKETDAVYRKFEQDILDWAEDQGLRIRSERDLKSAVREWKGDHARTLAVKADKPTPAPAKQTPQVTGKITQGTARKPVDYKSMSARDILKADGQKLFIPD